MKNILTLLHCYIVKRLVARCQLSVVCLLLKCIYLAVLLELGTWNSCFSQDFHLSQFDAAPHYFNPALTGIYFGQNTDYRIYSDYRTQWKSLGIRPFSTYYLAYDMPYKLYGLGGYLIHNRNGIGGMNTVNFMTSAAYKISNEINTPHNLSAGVQLGFVYRSFDPNNFTYDSQFSADAPGGFNQSLPSGENFDKTSSLKLDANMGVFYKYKKSEWKLDPWGGFAVYHVTKPSQSLTGIKKSPDGKRIDRTPLRWVLQAGADWKIREDIRLTPMILYMNQAQAHELNIGAIGFYRLKETIYDILGGLNYRWKDAVIFQAGMKYDQHIFTLSYDINTSYLGNYTNGRGAFEFSILLSGFKGKPLINPRFGRGKSIKETL